MRRTLGPPQGTEPVYVLVRTSTDIQSPHIRHQPGLQLNLVPVSAAGTTMADINLEKRPREAYRRVST